MEGEANTKLRSPSKKEKGVAFAQSLSKELPRRCPSCEAAKAMPKLLDFVGDLAL